MESWASVWSIPVQMPITEVGYSHFWEDSERTSDAVVMVQVRVILLSVAAIANEPGTGTWDHDDRKILSNAWPSTIRMDTVVD